MSENVFKIHSQKQQDLILSTCRITAAITGIQWAKTTSGAYWLKLKILEHKDKGDNFIVAAPTYKIMKQSTLPAFLKIMDGLGEYKHGVDEFHTNWGTKVFMRTGTDPDSIVGITDVRAIWGDEAGKFSLYFWENIQGRASFKSAPIMLTSTPYAMNWFYKEILKPFKTGLRPDIRVIQAKSCDNPYFPMDEYERKRKTMDPRRFNAMYNGEFEKMHGLVYDCFDEELNIVKPFQLPVGTKFYAGIDWGTTHPFVCVVRGITPQGNHYQVSEVYKTGWGITDFIQVAKKLMQVWDIQAFYCDPSQPGYILEFGRNKLPAVGADNDIKLGIGAHYTLIKERKFKIFEGSSPYTVDELNSYHYPEPKDLGPEDKDVEQVPVKQDDHTMDAVRYVTNMTYRAIDRNQPLVPGEIKPQETQVERIKRLKKIKSHNQQTESFS